MAADGILVTRPAGQAEPLCAALGERGLRVVHQPLLELEACVPRAGQSLADDLEAYSHIIFISTNAVRFSLPTLRRQCQRWPVGLRWYAVGDATARLLAEQGIEALTPGREMNSEGLLRLPSLHNLHRQRVLLVKGEGGRTLLREELQRRGASVDQLACYRRQPLALPEGAFANLLEDEQIGTIMLSSGEGCRAMLALLSREESSKFSDVGLIVPSPRVAELARDAGFDRIQVAANASDGAMLEALDDWRQQRGDD